jgi:hypothetical protein
VQFIEGKNKGGNYGPHGRTKEELLAEWTIFNQALHKPILNKLGQVVEPPVVGKKGQ